MAGDRVGGEGVEAKGNDKKGSGGEVLVAVGVIHV